MRKDKVLLSGIISLWIVLLVFTLLEFRQFSSIYVKRVADEQESYLSLMRYQMERNKEDNDEAWLKHLIHLFEKEYNTGSRNLGYVEKDDEIIFYHDASGTRSYQGEAITSLFSGNKKRVSDQSHLVSVKELGKSLVSQETIKHHGSVYNIGIIAQQDYLLSQVYLQPFKRHMLLYIGIGAVTIITFVYQITRKLKKKDEELAGWEITQKDNRKRIDRLLEDLKSAQGQHIEENIYGFLKKDSMEQLIKQLSDEQRKRSIMLVIHLNSDDKQAYLSTAAMLERMEVLKCVSCLWDEHNFICVLLNGNDQHAASFIRYFSLGYTSDMGRNLDELDIRVEHMRREI